MRSPESPTRVPSVRVQPCYYVSMCARQNHPTSLRYARKQDCPVPVVPTNWQLQHCTCKRKFSSKEFIPRRLSPNSKAEPSRRRGRCSFDCAVLFLYRTHRMNTSYLSKVNQIGPAYRDPNSFTFFSCRFQVNIGFV